MEAAACYIGECRDPERDAKIAMNLEGLYGLFIYTMIPVAFVVVLGATKLSDPLQADPKTIFGSRQLIPRPIRPISTEGSPFVSFVQEVPPFVVLYSPLSGPPPISCPTALRRCNAAAFSNYR